MDRQKIEELRQQISELSQTYDARFAGKARATRNISELDDIISSLEERLAYGQTLMNGDNAVLREVLDQGAENLQLYLSEREEIAKAQAAGVEAIKGAQLATWANFVFDEYRRHFAGQNRSTRDLGRLQEMIYELDAIRDDMLALLANKPNLEGTRKDMEIVEGNLDMYETEMENIRDARKNGTRDEQASALASAANGQFQLYRDLFAGKSRNSRRPALIQRMITNLEGILAQMLELNSKGYRNESNARNIQIVRNNLDMYQNEHAEIERARGEMTLEELAGSLGGSANGIMASYRENFAGMERATRDLDLLSAICDEMYEIALQMREVQDAAPKLEMNNRNLSIVIDNLVLYQTEYKRIQEAKGQA